MKKKFRIHFHPNANKKLVRYARDVHRELHTWQIERELGRRLGVNQRYIHDNLINGIEPNDATAQSRATRIKLFMKEYKPKPKTKRQREEKPLTPTQARIKIMAIKTKEAIFGWRHKR